jgi:hypothetical protein
MIHILRTPAGRLIDFAVCHVNRGKRRLEPPQMTDVGQPPGGHRNKPSDQMLSSSIEPECHPSEPERRDGLKDFSNAAFAPDAIKTMTVALEASVATLPEPVSAHKVNRLAETILRASKGGERDPSVLQRLALLELQLTPDAD